MANVAAGAGTADGTHAGRDKRRCASSRLSIEVTRATRPRSASLDVDADGVVWYCGRALRLGDARSIVRPVGVTSAVVSRVVGKRSLKEVAAVDTTDALSVPLEG